MRITFKCLGIAMLLCVVMNTNAQVTSLETFEDEADQSTTFTSNGQVFNINTILTQSTPFVINRNFGTGLGWNGTSEDDILVVSEYNSSVENGAIISISTANGAAFTLKRFYIRPRDMYDNFVAGTSLTVIGKLGGVIQFSATSNSGFNTDCCNPANGYTLIDLTNFGGSNNSLVAIDEYVVSLTGANQMWFDAMTWATVLPCSRTLATTARLFTGTQRTAGTSVYTNYCNNLVAAVAGTNNAASINGNVTARVWIESVQPSTPGQQYVKRHYEINPEFDASTSTGVVTLYFTQQEFNDFNAVSAFKLPMDAADAANYKNNLRIEKRDGVSSNGTGLPATYSGSPVLITPLSVSWNASSSRWEVVFNANGFGGFFAKSQTSALPVNWLALSATLNNNGQTLIMWKVSERGVRKYEIQKSANGSPFVTIGSINSEGDGVRSYSYTEPITLSGEAVYRILQIDIDGKLTYSNGLKLQASAIKQASLYPNPAKNSVQLTVFSELLNTNARLYNVEGRLLQTIIVKNLVQQIDLGNYRAGIYIIELANGERKKIVKE